MIQSKFGFENFKAGKFKIEDEPRFGRFIKVDCEQSNKSLIKIEMFQHKLLRYSLTFAIIF